MIRNISGKKAVITACIIWAAVALYIFSYQVRTDHKKTVTQVYRTASHNLFAEKELYEGGIHGFLYLPQAGFIFMPFMHLPQTPGELLWRLLCIGTFAYSVRRLAVLAGKERADEFFLLMTLIVIPISFSAMRNGQMTLPMTAAMIMGAVALAETRFGSAAFWLCLGIAMKPLVLVMAMLVFALYPSSRLRLIIGLVTLFAIPLLFFSSEYVVDTYSVFMQKMLTVSNPGAYKNYSDLHGMLGALGIAVDERLMMAVRALSAFGALVLAWTALKSERPGPAAILIFVISVTYLMLFNPKTENNTYAAFAPAFAVFTAWFFLAAKSKYMGWLFVVMTIGFALHHEAAKYLTPGREVWISPLLASVFAIYLVKSIISGPEPWEELRIER
ncbi:MAG: DUF2029 domain-containing protein [Nitrospira sp.]|nr:DUF2029 domain-containing protein [Nitrospira sp.]